MQSMEEIMTELTLLNMSPVVHISEEDIVNALSADGTATLNAEAHLQSFKENFLCFGHCFLDWCVVWWTDSSWFSKTAKSFVRLQGYTCTDTL